MGRTICAVILLLALPAMLGGCNLLRKWFPKRSKPTKDAAPHEIFIGSIEMVNPEQRFVLIHTGIKLNLQPGWRVETRPISGIKSVMTVSPEQKLNYLSADIVEGYPQKGEIVVLPPQTGPAPAEATDPAPNPPVPQGTTSKLPPPIP